MHTIVDVQGFFASAAAAPNGNLYTPVTPVRSTDTRARPYCVPDVGCTSVGPIPPATEIINTAAAPVNAVATVANITAVSPSSSGFVTADACASLVPGPQSRSNLNFAANDTVANLSVVPSVSTGIGVQFCTYSPSGLQEVIDVQGFFAPATQGGLGYTALTPSRALDSRLCWTDPITSVQRCGQINAANSIVRVKAPPGAASVVVNLTSMDATSNGYVTAGACNAMVAGPQSQSNLNAVVGSAVSNLAVVPVAPDGTYCAYMSSRMHLAIDVVGMFSAGGTQRYLPVTPVRVHDSRPPA